MSNQIELLIRIGQFGERQERIVVPISEELSRDLTEPLELSDEPFSLLLASPAFFGGIGDAISIRKKKFYLRRSVARALSKQIEEKLIDLFGNQDVIDGYSKQQLTDRNA